MKHIKQNNKFFKVKIGEAYLNHGYFNARIAHTNWFGENLSSIKIQLGEDKSNVFTGKINRTATNNDSPRIIAGVEYKNWIQKNFQKGDCFKVTMISNNYIKLSKLD